MNIFFLDTDPQLAAKYHCDKHVVKMIVEYAQLLSTAHRMLDGTELTVTTGAPWKKQRRKKRWVVHGNNSDAKNRWLCQASHYNHPSCIWVRESFDNYCWLKNLFINLNFEYHRRYGKIHYTWRRRAKFIITPPLTLLHNSKNELTRMPLAMPDKYKSDNPIQSYRNFYMGEKSEFAKWTNIEVPHWYNL